MDIKKAQKLVFDGLIKNPMFVAKLEMGHGRVFVTPDQKIGFVFPKTELVIDIDGVTDMLPDTDFEQYITEANVLERTKVIVDSDGTSSGYLAVFKKHGKPVYIKVKDLKYFGSCAKLYQGTSFGPVAVVEGTELKGVVYAEHYSETAEDELFD